ncbi:MAG: hypothetical protein ACQEP7_04790 [bacterium]
MDILAFVLLLAIIALLAILLISAADNMDNSPGQRNEVDAEELSLDSLDLGEEDFEEEEEDSSPGNFQAMDFEGLEVGNSSAGIDGEDEDLNLSFEPIYTFSPDPDQWTELSDNLNRYPWKREDEKITHEYDDRTTPAPPSEKIHEAINWQLDANTEAIHQRKEFQKLVDNLIAFIKQPRAAGAEAIEAAPWREKAPNLSRLIGERMIVLALGLSCHGIASMGSHREAFGSLLGETWNEDGLEAPLIYQGLGRLGLLTPTEMEKVQDYLRERVGGAIPRSEESSPLEMARFNSLVLAVSSGPGYPFPRGDNNLSRLWHWDENDPPLAGWEHLLPILYALWIHNWIADEEVDTIKDLAAMLGSWWDNNPPPEDFFDDNPETWEGILMLAWGWARGENLVWDKIKERYEDLEFEDEQLQEITEGYLDWLDYYEEEKTAPDESFTGRRMPPVEWIKPLPSDILDKASQPSFDYPETWREELGKIQKPDLDKIEDY